MPVKIPVAELQHFASTVNAGLTGGGKGGNPVRDALLVWAEMYRSDMKERYVAKSRGSGDWPALKKATIARRRKGKGRQVKFRRKYGKSYQTKEVKQGAVAILIDKSILIRGLDPQLNPGKGGEQFFIPGGIRVGYGGAAKHEEGDSSGKKPTIAQIARWHQTGAGNLPERKIIEEPSSITKKQMASVMQAAIQKAWNQSTKAG